jgi:hypothetical protein
MEVDMPAQSIQELEARLETSLKKLADTETQMKALPLSNAEDLSALHRVLSSYALTLVQVIKRKSEDPIRQKHLYLVEKLHETETEMVTSELNLAILGEESFDKRWNRYKAAKERWWRAIDEVCQHRTTYSSILKAA